MAQPLTEGNLSLDTGIKVNLDDDFLVVAFKKENGERFLGELPFFLFRL